MRFASLGSGSKGNATLVSAGDSLVLVDCGFTRRETEARLARLGVTPEQITAILVTHEHGDHASGVGPLSRHYKIPVFLSHGTAATGKVNGASEQIRINAGDTFTVGDFDILSIPVPHDAREPIQFRLSSAGECLGVLTDLGSITPHVIDAYSGCSALLLEFNHDLHMLRNGAYPAKLKHRVAGDYGHLNNQQAAALLEAMDTQQLRLLAVGHISEQNNSRELALAALEQVAHSHQATVFLACQEQGFDWLDVTDQQPIRPSLSA